MPKFKGMGGIWLVLDPYEDEPAAVVHNAEYTVIVVEELKQSRTTNGRNFTEGLPVTNRVESATFRVAEDDTFFVQALGFFAGNELTVMLRRGSLDQWAKITRTVVMSVRVENDQKRARWLEINCQHGFFEDQVPALPPGA